MPETTPRRRFGDRKEGRQLRTLAPLYKFMPFIMAAKNDAMDYFTDTIECTNIDRWMRAKRREGYKGLGMLHLFIATYVRAIAHCPGLNRFIAGQRIYARSNIEIVMMVKRSMTMDAPETAIKVVFEPTDTIFDVYYKLNAKIDEIKANDGQNNTEQVAGALMRMPRFLLRFAVWLLRVADYFDWIPRSLLNASPFHGTMIITDLGSLGIPPIYHHLYNFGNLPVFFAFGAKRRVVELDKEGQAVERKYVDYKVVMDERTIDGFYYATAFKFIRYYLRKPEELELPPKEIQDDLM